MAMSQRIHVPNLRFGYDWTLHVYSKVSPITVSEAMWIHSVAWPFQRWPNDRPSTFVRCGVTILFHGGEHRHRIAEEVFLSDLPGLRWSVETPSITEWSPLMVICHHHVIMILPDTALASLKQALCLHP